MPQKPRKEMTPEELEKQREKDRARKARSRNKPPKVSQPRVSQPRVSQPRVSQPRVSQPRVSQPRVSQPRVSQPRVSQPRVSQPRVSQPRVSQPRRDKSPKSKENQSVRRSCDTFVTTQDVTTQDVTNPGVTNSKLLSQLTKVKSNLIYFPKRFEAKYKELKEMIEPKVLKPAFEAKNSEKSLFSVIYKLRGIIASYVVVFSCFFLIGYFEFLAFSQIGLSFWLCLSCTLVVHAILLGSEKASIHFLSKCTWSNEKYWFSALSFLAFSGFLAYFSYSVMAHSIDDTVTESVKSLKKNSKYEKKLESLEESEGKYTKLHIKYLETNQPGNARNIKQSLDEVKKDIIDHKATKPEASVAQSASIALEQQKGTVLLYLRVILYLASFLFLFMIKKQYEALSEAGKP